MPDKGASSRQAVRVGAAFLAGAGLAVLFWLSGGDPEEPAPEPRPRIPGAPMPTPPPEPRVVVPADGPIVMRSNESIAIDRDDLTGDAPVRFELELPEGVGVRSARLVKPGPIAVRLDEELAGQRGTLSLALPVSQLQEPGRYLLDVRTDERTALPGRRFGIVVR